MQEDTLTRTRSVLERTTRDRLHLGGQIYVSRAGEVVADRAFGEARPGEPMTRDHLLLWLSSAKPVAALAILQLWERGRLELDDPVASHWPEFGADGKGEITIRHLLTHTGGIRRFQLGWPETPLAEVLAGLAAMRPEPRWSPGKKAGYHMSSSWFVLGELVRRLDGRPFSRYVRDEIFVPCAMDECWIGMTREQFRERREWIAQVYDTDHPADGQTERDHGWSSEAHVVNASPAGGGRGPMHQLGRLYEVLLAGGDTGNGRLISPQTVEAMTARHRVGLYDHTFRHKLDWGLGMIINSAHYGAEGVPYGYGPHASARTFGHSGYRSSTAFADPEHRLVVAAAFNGTPSDELHHRRFVELTAAIYEDLGLAEPTTAN